MPSIPKILNEIDLPRVGYAREAQILRAIPWGRSTLWSKSKSGDFPRPVKLSARVTAWKCEDVWKWLEAQEIKLDDNHMGTKNNLSDWRAKKPRQMVVKQEELIEEIRSLSSLLQQLDKELSKIENKERKNKGRKI